VLCAAGGVIASVIFSLVYVTQIAPYFAFCSIVLVSIILAFLIAENSFFHSFQEFENRFWTIIAFVGGIVLFFCPDSPLSFVGNLLPTFMIWSLVIVLGGSVHIYDRF